MYNKLKYCFLNLTGESSLGKMMATIVALTQLYRH